MENQGAINIIASQDATSDDATSDRIERLSFGALYVFALLLYFRPQEMFPSVFGTFPLVKLVAILALATFVVGRLSRGRRITIWPLELKMLAVLVGLSLVLTPLATSPDDSLTVLSDPFVKVVAIFILMINLIDTRKRLTSILRVIVIVGSFMALAAVRSYIAGDFTPKSTRIAGMVNGLFGNPNDLATSLDLIIPFALALALVNRRGKRLLYVLCAAALTAGVVVTFSRGGFLGLIAMAGFFAWKLGRFRRGVTALILVSTIAIFAMAVPASYGGRLGSIFNAGEDSTGSAQARLDLLARAADLAISHPIIGVGLGNFHIFSIGEQRAHNSYLEISVELGVLGLIAYLLILFGPFRYLRALEKGFLPSSRRRAPGPTPEGRTLYYLSITVQGALIGYAVCSFFGSIQYFWDLYLIVAYAISLKRIRELEQATQSRPVAAPSQGVLWSGQPALQRAN